MKKQYSFQDVRDRLPHRPPMLMIDGILEVSETECRAYKELSFAEPCFQGHFPDYPIFPGVLMIESMAQACALCLAEEKEDGLAIFAGIKEARFSKPVYPGCRMILEAYLKEKQNNFYIFAARALVDDCEVCHADFTICKK